MSEHDTSSMDPDPRTRLVDGNRAFVESGAIGDRPGETAPQEPFAAVLGCADARVPVEQVFGQGFNEVFVMRVAGNGLNPESLGSLQYAAVNLPSVRIAAVLGHTSCGAVTAGVDAWLDPSNYPSVIPTPELRSIVEGILIAARAAAEYLEGVHGVSVLERPGYRKALVETTVVVNAANNARIMREQIKAFKPELEVVFGIYDIATRRVGVTPDDPGLADAPVDAAAFDAIGFRVVESTMIRGLLD